MALFEAQSEGFGGRGDIEAMAGSPVFASLPEQKGSGRAGGYHIIA